MNHNEKKLFSIYLKSLIIIKASAAFIPEELPRHFAKFSTFLIERLCGQDLISDLYAFKAFNFLFKVFEISITDASGGSVSLTAPVTVEVSPDSAIVSVAGSDPTHIVIQHHGTAGWEVLDTRVDLGALTASVDATLMRNIPSVTGREDYVQIRLFRQNRLLCAEPVFGKSNLIYTLIRSDGMVKIPLDSGGLYAGEKVSVTLY